MDPLAHTLFGAALAETGLRRAGRLATATLIIGANLPDVDATCAIAGENAALHLRRGLTHGVLAWVVLPWVLAGAMVLYDRLWRRRDPQRVPPPRFGTLLALAYLGVISHPALDWLNTYGVRLLMPFSERWFYGDTLFIVDPWMWLLPGGAVMLARAHTRLGLAAWMVLGAATTALVLFSGAAPVWARVLWCAGVAVIAVARFRGGTALPTAVIARVVLAAVVFYVAAMFAGGRLAERQAATWARAQGVEVEDVVAAPLPARLLQRDVVIATPDRYLFSSLDWLRGDLLRPANRPMPRLDLRDPVIAAALEAPQVRGFRTWVRYPSAQVERNGDGFRVTLFDVRYARTDQRRAGIGLVIVELDGALRPR